MKRTHIIFILTIVILLCAPVVITRADRGERAIYTLFRDLEIMDENAYEEDDLTLFFSDMSGTIDGKYVAAQMANKLGLKGFAKYAGDSSLSFSGGIYEWPVPGCTRITSPFAFRNHPVLKTIKMHHGIDIGAPVGKSIIAAEAGIVTISGYDQGGYGNYIKIDHGEGMETLYGHNSMNLVSVGERVERGQEIAKIGSTGRSTGPHLHFGVKKNGTWINPQEYVTPNSGWATNPTKICSDINMLTPETKEKALMLKGLWEMNLESDIINSSNYDPNSTYSVKILETYRTAARQDWLYYNTNATKMKGGGGPHNRGEAFDVVVIKDGKASWGNDVIFVYDIVGRYGKSVGLTWGGDWKSFVDRPHFQLNK